MTVTGRIVTLRGVNEGRITVEGGRIASVRRGKKVEDQWIFPGFVDIHNHGGGGHTSWHCLTCDAVGYGPPLNTHSTALAGPANLLISTARLR